MSADKQPLYKVLNSERTNGDFILNDNYKRELKQNGELVMVAAAPATFEGNYIAEVNAEYTALAVNNLHHLTDAMETIDKFLNSSAGDRCPRPIKSLILGEIKEALNRIS